VLEIRQQTGERHDVVGGSRCIWASATSRRARPANQADWVRPLLVETPCVDLPCRHALFSNEPSSGLDEFVGYAINSLECSRTSHQEDFGGRSSVSIVNATFGLTFRALTFGVLGGEAMTKTSPFQI
jgi:hypothetical protein